MKWLPALAGALALLCGPSQAGAQTYQQQHALKQALIQHVQINRAATWRWQDLAHARRTRTVHMERHAGVGLLHRLVRYWAGLRNHAWRNYAQQAQHQRTLASASFVSADRPAHYSAWLCIHEGEGSWTANTGNGYYGGLQMDYGFMSAYGGKLLKQKGTADHWTPLEQMQVAEVAYASGRGFYPWPNTARACGLS